MSKMIRKENLYESVVKHIQSQIINGQLKPGDKLPPQDKFAQQLGVSRVTLREALKALDSMGLVNIQQGGGTYISEVTPDLIMQPILPAIMMKESLMEIVEARIYVEMGTVSLCAKNRDQEVLIRLQKTVERMERSLKEEDPELFSSSDLEFHLAIGQGSGNSILARILKIIQDILYRQQKKINIFPQIRQESYRYHQDIIQRIKNQDVEGARDSMLAHLENVREFAIKKDLDGIKRGDVDID